MEEALSPQQQAEQALRLLNEQDFNKALETIAPLKEIDANFVHYFTARVAYRRNNITFALTELTKITAAASELLPNVQELTQKVIAGLVRLQVKRVLEMFDAGQYDPAKLAIHSMTLVKKEPNFCNFMRAKIAHKQGDLRLAVECLVKITNTKDEHSAVSHDIYIPAQKMLAEILNEQAQIALEAIKISDFNTAKTAILIIEACNTESTFCNYIKAEIVLREGKIDSALEYLRLAAESAPDNKNKSLITFDTNTAVQDLLVGLVTGQLKDLSTCKIPTLSTDTLSLLEHISLDEEVEVRAENINDLLAFFVTVGRTQNSGIRFYFHETLSLESQLRVLENLKTLYVDAKQKIPETSPLLVTLFGEKIKEEAKFSQYITREQTLIKGHIAAEKGLWAQAHAYYYQAFSFGIYKEELAHLRAFYFKQVDNIRINKAFSHEQCYSIMQSLFFNNLIDAKTYVRWLGTLRCTVLFPSDEDTWEEEADDQSSLATGDSSAIGGVQQPSKDKEPAGENSSEEEVEAQPSEVAQADNQDFSPSPEAQELADKIEKQMLLYDPVLKTESLIDEAKQTWLEGPKFTQTEKQVYGEDFKTFSKQFFESAWNLSRFKPFNAVAVFFAAFAFLPALVVKKYQLSEFRRKKRSADEISKDDAALNERRTEMRDHHFKKARYKESVAESKRHLMLAPKKPVAEMQAAADAQLAAEQVERAGAMQLPKVIRSSGPGSPPK